MAIINLFSKRQKRLRGDIPDVYTYDDLPRALRVQIVHIWNEVLGSSNDYSGYDPVHEAYKYIVDMLCREYGLFELSRCRVGYDRNYRDELINYFLEDADVEKQLDVVELSFRVMNVLARKPQYLRRPDASERVDNAIEELNHRFKEHGIGFRFEKNEIIKIDSELLHSEVVKPALRLLNEQCYQGAQQEFLGAYEHYRHGRNKESLNDCLKSFESTMKAICDKHKWDYKPTDAARNLINVCFDNNLVPEFWQQQLNSLQSILESSIPTGRNKLSGHGQGTSPTSVPDYLTAYMLHMTASTLVFLTTAEKKLPSIE